MWHVIASALVVLQEYGVASPSAAGFVDDFKRKFGIRIIEEDEESCVFDVMGIDAPLANALRRILLAAVRRSLSGHATARGDRHRLSGAVPEAFVIMCFTL